MLLTAVNRSKTVFIVVFQFFAAFSLLAQTVFSGVLDPNFGTGGRVTTDFPFTSSNNYSSGGHRVFVQPSGRIVGIGSHAQPGGKGGMMTGVAMTGLTQAGMIDGNFNSGKILMWDAGYFTNLHDAHMLPDGRILHLSRTMTLLGGVFLELIRTNVDGSRDTGFVPDLNPGGSMLVLHPVKFSVQTDGRINVLVYQRAVGSGDHRYYLIRLKPDGTRDTTFGTGGVREITRLSAVPGRIIIAVRTLPNGKTLICGSLGPAKTSQPQDFLFVLRLDSNGNADHSFGLLGLAKIPFPGQTVFANDLLVQPDGKYVIVGAIRNPDMDALMVRITQRGKTDGRFGNAGVVITDFTPESDDFGMRATLNGSGKIIIAGQAGQTATTPRNFLVARYATNGTLEASTQTALTPAQNSGATDVIIQPDGKILVIGYTKNPNPSVNGSVFAFARYTDITND